LIQRLRPAHRVIDQDTPSSRAKASKHYHFRQLTFNVYRCPAGDAGYPLVLILHGTVLDSV